MNKKIAVIKGDGIGVEIVDQTLRVLKTIEEKYNHQFALEFVDMGGCAIDKFGVPLPDCTLDVCKKSDAVLLGAVGGPAWDSIDPSIRPEKGLLKIRKELGLFANIRPVVIYKELKHDSPLKDSIVEQGVDIVIVRELTGGIYFGDRGSCIGDFGREAHDTERYNEMEIRRIAIKAFEIASGRQRKKLCLVDKANVLDSSKLWREVVKEVATDYPSVSLDFMYVDNCAMQLVKNPAQFDVILTNNIFGDILSDEASMITGSIGMLASSSFGESGIHLYEPIHGSAPDIAGKNIANPIATILSLAMMLRHSFALETEACAIENAVEKTLADGYRTGDLSKSNPLGTIEITDEILKRL